MVVAAVALGQGVNGTQLRALAIRPVHAVSGAAVEATNVRNGALHEAASTNANLCALVNLPVRTHGHGEGGYFKTYTHTSLAIAADRF